MKGGEIEVIGQLTDRLKMTAGYSYIDTEILEESAYDVLISYMPEHMINLWGSYQVDDKLNVGLGMNSVSEVSSYSTNATADAYSTFNGMVAYQFTPSLKGQVKRNEYPKRKILCKSRNIRTIQCARI